MKRGLLCVSLILVGGLGMSSAEGEKPEPKTPAERGREALFTRSFSPAFVSLKAYDNAWKNWGLKEKPADYAEAFRNRYGLAEPPYPNDGLPMGLRKGPGLFTKGITGDCMLCHAGSIAGQTVIGLGNASLDMQSLFEDLAAADGIKRLTPFPASRARGSIEAEAVVNYLMQYRDADLNIRLPVKYSYRTTIHADIPAWWLLKRKKTMFHTGAIDSRAVRVNMTFMLSPFNSGPYIKKHESIFRDIKAFLLSLEAPRYPFPIDKKKAARGEKIFVETCTRCHGTYGPNGKYPNKIVDIDIVDTDRTLFEGYSKSAAEHYKKSWFGREKGPDGKPYMIKENRGFQAPPLDGIWATAPYFHNGSVPTVYHVLNSKSRPRIYTRSFRTGKEDYDPVKLGWKITILDKVPDRLPPLELRKIYDASQPGWGNGGHTFGDKLTQEERLAVIEYLKTL
jgi:hypothetical protein